MMMYLLSRNLRKTKEQDKQVHRGGPFNAERTASAKILRQE